MVRLDQWHQADQRDYVSDTRKFQQATGWKQKIGVEEGGGKTFALDYQTQKNGRSQNGRSRVIL